MSAVVTSAGMKVVIARVLDRYLPRTWLALRIARGDRHFEPEFWLLPLFCDRRHVAVDVGANIGEFAYLMTRHAKAVIAFEPNPDLWPDLRRRVGNKVRIEGDALSSAPGTASFRYVKDNTGVATVEARNSLGMIEDQARVRTRNVTLRTLDSYGLDAVSFIKIDVEGHEEAVIEGAVDTLRRNRPVLLIESEDRHNPGAPGRLVARLAMLGYSGFFLRAGRLTDVALITDAERDPANLMVPGKVYVNNYIFIPTERSELIARVRALEPFG